MIVSFGDQLCYLSCVGLLIRFRLHPIAVIADVEKAFLNIGLHDRDRDNTRFLWLKNPDLELTEQNLEVF